MYMFVSVSVFLCVCLCVHNCACDSVCVCVPVCLCVHVYMPRVKICHKCPASTTVSLNDGPCLLPFFLLMYHCLIRLHLSTLLSHPLQTWAVSVCLTLPHACRPCVKSSPVSALSWVGYRFKDTLACLLPEVQLGEAGMPGHHVHIPALWAACLPGHTPLLTPARCHTQLGVSTKAKPQGQHCNTVVNKVLTWFVLGLDTSFKWRRVRVGTCRESQRSSQTTLSSD